MSVRDRDYDYRMMDADFKVVIHESDVLCSIAKALVKELENESIDEIRKHINPGGDAFFKGMNTELINDNGETFYMDNLFSIDLGTERVGLLLNIESQGRPNPGYPLTDRAQVYTAGLIYDQKGTVFKGSDYGKL